VLPVPDESGRSRGGSLKKATRQRGNEGTRSLRLPGASRARWLTVVGVCALVWALMRATFFLGVAGSDDIRYMRFAACWDRPPANHLEARLIANGLVAGAMKLGGRTELAAVTPALLSSGLMLGCVLYGCYRFAGAWHALWAGLLVAVLPMNVDEATTVSAHAVMTALLTLGTLLFVLGPESSALRLVAAGSLALGVVTHYTGAYYVAWLAAAALIVDRRRFLKPVALTAAAGVLFILADMAVFHFAYGDALGRFRACVAQSPDRVQRVPLLVEGGLNWQFFVFPLRGLLFSKAFGVALVVALGTAVWRYRRFPRPLRVLALTALACWLWMSFGTQVPWDYRPFARNTRYLHPLLFSVAILFACAVVASRRRLVGVGVGLAVLGVCVLNLMGSGPWGQNVEISRELLAYAKAHPQTRFVTDVNTLNEMYIINRLRTPANVVALDDRDAGRIIDPAAFAARVTQADLKPSDQILVNVLNHGRNPDFGVFVAARAGGTHYQTQPVYRTICRLVPPLRAYSWAIRRPAARVCACTAAATRYLSILDYRAQGGSGILPEFHRRDAPATVGWRARQCS